MAKVYLLILLTMHGCLASVNHYLKMSKTDAVGHDIAYFECGEGKQHLSRLSEVKKQIMNLLQGSQKNVISKS